MMKKTMKVFLVLAVLAVFLAACSNPSQKREADPNGRWIFLHDEPTTGIDSMDGLFYSFWHDQDPNNYQVQMALTWWGNCYLSLWDLAGGGNTVMGKGLEYGSRYSEIDYEALIFDVTAGDLAYLCLYGWMSNPAEAGPNWSGHPVVEYYIVESHGPVEPPDNWTRSQPGTVDFGIHNIDGADYHVWRTERVNQPWIVDSNPYSDDDRGTFWQYWSVRVNQRIEGTIDFDAHVDTWDNVSKWVGGQLVTLNIGDFDDYYQIMATEGFGSSGGCTMRDIEITP